MKSLIVVRNAKKQGKNMKIRKVQINDWKILFDWRNDIETRKNSHNMELVKEDDHKKWLKSVLENKNRELFREYSPNYYDFGKIRISFYGPQDNRVTVEVCTFE